MLIKYKNPKYPSCTKIGNCNYESFLIANICHMNQLTFTTTMSCLTSKIGNCNYESLLIANISHICTLFRLEILRKKTAIKNKSSCYLTRIFITTSRIRFNLGEEFLAWGDILFSMPCLARRLFKR